MDPVADLDLPPATDGGNMASGSAQSRRSASPPSHRSHAGLGASINNNPPSQRSQAENHVMLRISPAAGSTKFGYIYLSNTERRHEEAITAYFDSVGREVAVLPCPDFELFIADNNLLYRDLLFVSDLPRYIIPAGIRILEAQNYDDSPRYNWLPDPPSLSNFGPSSRSSDTSRAPSSQRSRSLLSRHASAVGSRPDPDGFDSHPSHHLFNPRAPFRHVSMEGNHAVPGGSYGGMSPLTFKGSGSMGGGASVASSRYMGCVGGASSTVPLDIFSTSTTVSPALVFVPLAQPSADSDSTSDLSAPVPPPTTLPPVTTIKDKASDLGLKDITDKDSWTEAKKIIDAHLRRHPYCPGPDFKLLVTSKSNAVASAWWEEVINYYVKPPISDLFVEESRFDGKVLEMIEHIDKYFNPSGTVDSLSHIFDLIDINQAQDESVIMLKACFFRVFASLKMGGVAIDSALQVGFMLRALLSSYHGVVQDFCLGRHLLSTVTLQTVVDQCVAYG